MALKAYYSRSYRRSEQVLLPVPRAFWFFSWRKECILLLVLVLRVYHFRSWRLKRVMLSLMTSRR